MREKHTPPHRSGGAGLGLSGRGRTFAAFLQPSLPADALVAAGGCALVYPHRGTVEAALGREFHARAWLDPEGCEARGVDGYVLGSVACFAATDPSAELALRLAREIVARGESEAGE